jgi:serine/threonine protein kinase
LKQDNFRVTEDGTVKIIDFGLGRYETDGHTGFTTIISPCYRFIAPELIIPHMDDVSMSVTKASDAYAFSMTALQVNRRSPDIMIHPFLLIQIVA